jgi:hypothetical protein
MTDSTPQAVRPPVALGCVGALAAVVVLGAFLVFFIIFLDSGADTGKVRLEVPEAYAEGSIEFIGEKNFFLVRLRDGSFLALSDLDAANRANQARRCRVQLTPLSDSGIAADADQLRGQMSAQSQGAASVLRETCNGAIYDLAGARLVGEGPNLDRFPISIDGQGRLLVDSSKRECSERAGGTAFASIDCP